MAAAPSARREQSRPEEIANAAARGGPDRPGGAAGDSRRTGAPFDRRTAIAWVTGALILAFHAWVVVAWFRRTDCLGDVGSIPKGARLAQAGWGDAWTLIRSDWYPPGYDLALAVVFRAFGFQRSLFLWVNLALAAVLFFAMFGIGRDLADRATGLAVAALTLLAPFVTWLLRGPTRDWGITGPVALAVWLLVRSNGRWRTRDAWTFGLAAGAALWIKWTAVAFLAGPALVLLVRGARSSVDRNRKRIVLFWAVAAGTALAVAAPYYLASPTLGDLGFHVRKDPMNVPYGSVLPPAVLSHYLGRVLAPLSVAALAVLLAARRTRFAGAVLAGWALLPLAAFEALPHREVRHVAAAMPPLVAAIPIALSLLPRRAPRAIATIAVIATAAAIQVSASLRPWVILDSAAAPQATSSECVGFFGKLCASLNRRIAERKPGGPAVVGMNDEVADCLSWESLQLCALETGAAGREPAWTLRVAPLGDDPARFARTARVDFWITLAGDGQAPPLPGFSEAARLPSGCGFVARLWTKGGRPAARR